MLQLVSSSIPLAGSPDLKSSVPLMAVPALITVANFSFLKWKIWQKRRQWIAATAKATVCLKRGPKIGSTGPTSAQREAWIESGEEERTPPSRKQEPEAEIRQVPPQHQQLEELHDVEVDEEQGQQKQHPRQSEPFRQRPQQPGQQQPTIAGAIKAGRQSWGDAKSGSEKKSRRGVAPKERHRRQADFSLLNDKLLGPLLLALAAAPLLLSGMTLALWAEEGGDDTSLRLKLAGMLSWFAYAPASVYAKRPRVARFLRREVANWLGRR